MSSDTGIPRPAAEHYILEDQVGFILRQVSQRHATVFTAHMGSEITPTQWAAMAKLYEIGPTSQNLLGRMTAMDVATIKGVVDRLRKRGLIGTSTDEGDARRRLVALTEAGQSLVAGHIAAGLAISAETLAPLDPSERRELLRLLEKMK